MKHVALTLLAAACGALSASALDASNARIWLSEKIQPDFAPVGAGIASDKLGTTPAFARSWQYVSIPLHVEGVAKGDSQPHYIPELKVRISLAVATADEKGKTTGSPELLSKEITYTDIPLTKGKKANMGESVVNVGVFISPSNAFKLSGKDGNLAKKILAVAVEGNFQGADCNRIKEKPNDNVATAVVLDNKVGKNLAEGWWKKKGGDSGAVLASISETPFAADYARMGFPPTKPMYGAGLPAPSSSASAGSTAAGGPVSASSSAASSSSAADSSSESSAPSSAPYDPRAAEAAAAASAADSSGEDATATGKTGKKAKKSRR